MSFNRQVEAVDVVVVLGWSSECVKGVPEAAEVSNRALLNPPTVGTRIRRGGSIAEGMVVSMHDEPRCLDKNW